MPIYRLGQEKKSTTVYRVEGHNEGGNNWDSDYAGNGDDSETRQEAEELITFLLEEFPETDRSDWRIVEVEVD